MTIPIERQIKCVEREIAMRKHLYPVQIKNERLTKREADDEIVAMQAVLETLRSIPRETPK